MAIVLLVDPSQTIRRVVEMAFKGSGHDIIAAATATEGRQALVRYRPAAVLVNYLLPDGSGVLFCESLKENPATAHIPVVVLGGSYAPFDEAEARSAGADAVVIKPFETDTLLEPLLELVESSMTVPATTEATRPAQVAPPAPARPVQPTRPAQPVRPSQAVQPTAVPQRPAEQHSGPVPVPRAPGHRPAVPSPPQPVSPGPPRPTSMAPDQIAAQRDYAPAPSAPSGPQPPVQMAQPAPPVAPPPRGPAVDPELVRDIVEDLLPQIALDTLQQMLADWLEARLRNYIYELVQQELSRYR